MADNLRRHGGQLLIDALEEQGVDRVFCVPGESFLAPWMASTARAWT